ncbi:head maturation protease, ClpP-related [Neptunicella sp.]|uniref:head maturation protease, ClpP-related n=1 Tax=Neptunicella sp. TaxID=2125986 RepID=UPI003F69286C
MAKGFFKIENAAPGKINLHINGVVGDWGNSSDDVIYQIENQTADEINVFIQSPGGSAFEGIAIYNVLRKHSAKVVTHILGAAASAASIIFMAGDERIMPANTYLMIHEPTLGIYGKAKELREAADFLDGMTTALAATYSPYINIDDGELMKMLVAESWINATDALEMGFATTVDDEIKIAALSHDFTSRFDNLPTALTQCPVSTIVGKINNIKDFEHVLRESGGCSKSLATALVSKAKDIMQGEPVDHTEAIFNTLKNFKLN